MSAVRPIAGAGLLVALSLACRNVDAVDPPAVIDGNWLYHETLVDNLYGLTCADTGTYTFTQSGPKFSGSYVQTGKCHNGSDPRVLGNSGHGQVTDGSVTSVHVQFTAGGTCTYEGLLSNAKDAVNSGTGICQFVDSATSRPYSMQITWTMSKQ